jgi:hypothetical protein
VLDALVDPDVVVDAPPRPPLDVLVTAPLELALVVVVLAPPWPPVPLEVSLVWPPQPRIAAAPKA